MPFGVISGISWQLRIYRGRDRRRGMGSFGTRSGASHCNQ